MSVFRGFPHLLGCHVIHILVKIGSGRFGENCLLKLVLVYLIPTQWWNKKKYLTSPFIELNCSALMFAAHDNNSKLLYAAAQA